MLLLSAAPSAEVLHAAEYALRLDFVQGRHGKARKVSLYKKSSLILLSPLLLAAVVP